MSKRYYAIFVLINWIVLRFMFCAVQGAPSGGPADETPPRIIATFPSGDSTMVPEDAEISITFSEAMNRNSVLSAVFISPLPESEFELDWDKQKLKIKLNEPLRKDQTYVISIGSSAKDLRSNILKRTFSFAFSTGRTIDSGVISGKVIDYSGGVSVVGIPNAIIWAYKLNDTLQANPLNRKGEFITQTDADGDFRLTHLSPARYRLFVVTNTDNDFEFSPATDNIGIPSGDIAVLDSGSVNPVVFAPVSMDTVSLHLQLLEHPDQNHLRLHFSNSINNFVAATGDFDIFTFPGEEIVTGAVKNIYYSDVTKNIISLYTDALISGGQYQLKINGMEDVFGNQIIDLFDSTTIFEASSLLDTTVFLLTALVPPDSSENIPVYSQVDFIFNQSVDIGILSRNIHLSDSLNNVVSGRFIEISSSEFSFIPDRNLRPNTPYIVTFNTDSIESGELKSLNLTKSEFVFKTMETKSTGAILGDLSVIGDSLKYPVIVSLHSQSSQSTSPIRISLTAAGQFEFQGVIPGEYLIEAFLDIDGNRKWSPGTLKPYKPAEPFTVYSQEVTVRPGIENTGNNIVPIRFAGPAKHYLLCRDFCLSGSDQFPHRNNVSACTKTGKTSDKVRVRIGF